MTKGLTTMKAERDTRRALDVEEAVMHLGVVHTIRDRATWDRAFFADKDFPPGFTLVGTVTQDDVSRAICSGTRRASTSSSARWTGCSGTQR